MTVRADETFSAFVEVEYPRLVGALALYCGDLRVAEELTQDAFARAYQRWPEVAAMARPASWVHVVAFNLARSSFRRTSAERRAFARHGPAPAALPPETADAVAVRAAVASLPERQRETVVCRYFLDLTVAEAADLLGTSPGAVKAATFKAVRSLREQFDVAVDEAGSRDHV